MLWKFVKRLIYGKTYTPYEFYLKYGRLTKQNVTEEQMIQGAERQYKRFCDPEYQSKEMRRRLDELIPPKKEE